MSTIPVGKRLRSNQSPQWGFEAKRTVLQGKMEGPRPDKFAFSVKLERVVDGRRPVKS